MKETVVGFKVAKLSSVAIEGSSPYGKIDGVYRVHLQYDRDRLLFAQMLLEDITTYESGDLHDCPLASAIACLEDITNAELDSKLEIDP